MSPSNPQFTGMDLPCLGFHHCGRSTELFSASEKTRIIVGDMDDDLLKDKVVCPTARGFLLVRDSASMAAFLCNPRNGDKIILPPLHGMEDSVLMDSHCLLSDEPTLPGCVVLLVETEVASIRYCHPGDDQWVKYDYDIGTLPVSFDDDSLYEQEVICPITAHQGKFYFKPLGTEMGVLEFCPEPEFSFIEIDDTIAADGSYGLEDENKCASVRLVESNGELYRVTMLFDPQSGKKYEIYKASVHRMDFAERRWYRVNDLGGHVFLCSLFYFGASCSSGEGGLQEDCVYLVYPVKKALQVFNIKDGTNEMLKLEEAPSSDKAFWVLPTSASSRI